MVLGELVFFSILFLLWGSFLNVVAYRIIRNESIISPRSQCPACKHALAWYDLIPLFSWIFLRGTCRYCQCSISALYPFIELITALCMMALYTRIPLYQFPVYFLFFSALIVTIRTDIETMLISRYTTLFAIPVSILACAVHLIPLTITQSITGMILGYALLWIAAKLCLYFVRQEGMGQGNIELLAFIGSVTGPLGVWATLLLSTTIGSILGIIYMRWCRSSRSLRIPFGPFLAFGAIMYVLFMPYFKIFLLP